MVAQVEEDEKVKETQKGTRIFVFLRGRDSPQAWDGQADQAQ
jgi:hypothetical protein